MNNIVVVIPGFNNKKWFRKNIDSVVEQEYKSWRAIYTDDCSDDGSGRLVYDYIQQRSNKITFVQNKTRVGALKNLYDMIHSCDDDDIIVTLDADDWFPNGSVLDRVAEEYEDNNTWLTYGQYKEYPHGTKGCSRQIPPGVIEKSKYRDVGWYSSHLRTFRCWLFKKIKKEDLMYENKFFASAWDLAMMFPMLEMSGKRAKFIPDVLYVYNTSNPLNDHKVAPKQQKNFARIIRNRNRYKLL